MDGADDGSAPLGQGLHERHHLERGGTVQATVQREAPRGQGEVGMAKGVSEWGSYYEGEGAGRKGVTLATPMSHPHYMIQAFGGTKKPRLWIGATSNY